MNSYFSSQCPVQIFRVINKSSKEKHLLLLYNLKTFVKKRGGRLLDLSYQKTQDNTENNY